MKERTKMKAEDIKKVVCIGAGTIGASWATYFLWKGLDVCIQDRNEEALDRGRGLIHSNLNFLEEKGVISSNVRREAESRAIYTVDIQNALKDAQYVQESAFESYEVKQEIVSEMDKYAPEAIYA